MWNIVVLKGNNFPNEKSVIIVSLNFAFNLEEMYDIALMKFWWLYLAN
jgi:hypothetical protein